MTGYSRYAIYYAPERDDPLAVFGAAWFGWDIASGVSAPRITAPGLPLPLREVTATPSKYGFHGTLKPPFRATAELARIDEAAAAIASAIRPFHAPRMRLARLGGFLALTPTAPSPVLAALADAMVRGLDGFRAAPTAAELDKRRAGALSPRQEAMLSAWGYPYVGPEFRFHLTLTGLLSAQVADSAAAALAPLVSPHLARFRLIRDVALCGEIAGGPNGGRFRIIRRIPLRG